MWLKHRPVNPYTSQAMTFDDFLIGLCVPNVLPPRHSQDIEPLVEFLTRVIFLEQRLELPKGHKVFLHGEEAHSQLNGKQTVITECELESFYPEHKTIYGYKDWVDALEKTLERAGCPKHTIVFGQKYRVGMNWPNSQGQQGVLINVQPELLDQCKYRNSQVKSQEIIRSQ